jgi:hypothetical protein
MMPWLTLVAALTLVAGVAPAAADEAKTPVSASMLLNILSAPVSSRDVAYDESLKDAGSAPPQRGFVLQPDGSLRYGTDRLGVSVTVRNPCPPGSFHDEPRPLPGRRARN